MDIMMPEIDGIDTIREIRKLGACKDLPIIAVTAKAMKGDREKCIEAGAWDYLSKPVETELMIGMLRAWLLAERAAPDAGSIAPMSRTSKTDELPKDRASILLVDDRPDKHVVYRSILEELGQNIVSATSGEEALRQVLKQRVRGHPARRQHARPRRARDRGADPQPASARRMCRSSSSPRTTTTKCAPPGATRSAPSTSWSRRSFRRSCAPRSRCSSTCTCSRSWRSSRPRERGQLAAERTARAAAERANAALRVPRAGERRALRIAQRRRDDARARSARRAVPGRRRRGDGSRRRRSRHEDRSRLVGGRCRGAAGHRIVCRRPIAAGGARRSSACWRAGKANRSVAAASTPGSDAVRALPAGRLDIPERREGRFAGDAAAGRARPDGRRAVARPRTVARTFDPHLLSIAADLVGPRRDRRSTTRCSTRRCTTRTGARTSSWRCSRTSSATRSRRSPTPCTC